MDPSASSARAPIPLPPVRWPTEEEARASRLYAAAPLGPRTATSRTWVPAMVPWRATEDGFVTDDVVDWYGRFADGRPGVLVVEATGVRDVPSGPLLRAGDDRFIPGLARLVEEVRRRSGGETLLLLQILDFLAIRRRPEPAKFLRRFLEITPDLRERAAEVLGAAPADDEALREALCAAGEESLAAILGPRNLESLQRGYRERVTDLHLPHVRDLPRTLPPAFASAARRAADAGFDGVELHYAHAYTLASFLSLTNTREDGWGGSPEGRVRLPLDVFSAVRAEVPRDFVVGCRMLGDEVIEGGSRVADAAGYACAFAAAGMDFVSLSKGGKFDDAKQPAIGEAAYPYTGPSGHECMPTVRIDARGPFGRNVPLAAEVRAAIRAAGHGTPVVTAGGIHSFEMAEEILRRGDADFVAAARQSLADPDWWLKVRLGRGDEVRRCVYTNYCEGLDQKHRQVTCQLWDRLEVPGETGVVRSADGRRRLLPPRWRGPEPMSPPRERVLPP